MLRPYVSYVKNRLRIMIEINLVIFLETRSTYKQFSGSGSVRFLPPGTGSVSQRYGSGSFHHQEKTMKNSKKNLFFKCFETSYDFFFIYEESRKCTILKK